MVLQVCLFNSETDRQNWFLSFSGNAEGKHIKMLVVLTVEARWQNPSEKELEEVIFYQIQSQLFAMGDLLAFYRNCENCQKGPWNNAAFPLLSILFSCLRNRHKEKFLYSGKTTSPADAEIRFAAME